MRLRKIVSIDRDRIEILSDFFSPSYWLKIEAMAQTLGLHLRYILDFQQHVFLVKIRRILILRELNTIKTGIIQGRKIAQSQGGALYRGLLFADCGDKIGEQLEGDPICCVRGEFILGHREFDASFKKQTIISHFKGLFRCLKNI